MQKISEGCYQCINHGVFITDQKNNRLVSINKKKAKPNYVYCQLCEQQGKSYRACYLVNHLVEVHGITGKEYLEMFPDSQICSESMIQNLSQPRPRKKKGEK